MRKRINNSKDSSSSRPSGDGQKSFRRSSGKARPEAESRFSKPSIKKSSLRVASGGSASDKPASFRPRAFDKDTSPRDFRTDSRGGADKQGFDKPGHDKPRFDKPRFDKPGIGKPRSSDSREFKPRTGGTDKQSYDRPNSERSGSDRPGHDRPRYSDRDAGARPFRAKSDFTPRERTNRDESSERRPASDRPAYDKPRSSDRDRAPREFKPRGEFNSGERSGSERPGFDKPGFDKPRTYGSDADPRDFKRDGERPAFTGRSEKPGFKKKDESELDQDFAREEMPSDEGANRRVGRFETAPHYKLGTYEKKNGLKKRKDENPEIRLNRYIANAGICSRREADDLIAAGQISVNNKIVTEMGHKVLPTDVVKYGKKTLNPEKFVYVLINKPKDYITTTDDPEERKTVLDLIKGACSERIYPVGRLDRNTTGLLLMTNDGALAKKLTHPSGNVKKIYQAELDKAITNEDFEKLQTGLTLEDGFIRPDEVGIVTADAMVVGLEIHSGHNRIVRRMFEHLGYEVQKLDRTVFAGLDKKDLPRGKWRFLSEKEVIKLKYMM
ncbi:pseudouridine synthase [Dyadobacter psychrotolerans]|uniref:Pseudouridine synthase n=1 Tax=Dyadobacter psychrotolerans TaxID=2541721 RepID=A0A4R5DAY0_9BACT|nr:pseudouridine synthase [Dyadobacter psychrotolerans]TDE10017.1 pseudouridine synthase [Dyadobacter psychrotolerans]